MVKVAFFGHNSNEPTVRKRTSLFKLAGAEVIGVMPYRGTLDPTPFDLLSLGETHDNSYFSRLGTLVKSFAMTPRRHAQLRNIDLIYARNLDMLMCAHVFRLRNRLKIPIVYECLDIHVLLVGNKLQTSILQWLEGILLRRSDMLVYSSERYIDQYFAIHHPGDYSKRLVENRLNQADVGPRPTSRPNPAQGQLKLGWIGNLRCRRTLGLLKQLGEEFAPQLQIEIHGYPAANVFPDFEAEIKNAPGLTYHGRYNGAQDLAKIYGDLDAVWAADWYEAGHNSIWQIPNRIYEGGYFGVPAITLQETETARMINQWNAGWDFDEPAETTVPALIQRLLNDGSEVKQKSDALFALPLSTFVETPAETRAMIDEVITKS